MKRYSLKERLKYMAENNTKRYEEEYSDKIQNCINNSVIYRDGTNFQKLIEPLKKIPENLVSIDYLDKTTSEAIYLILDSKQNQNKKIAALNFANYKNAGGHFLQGGHSQEESLCQSSYLYNVLSAFNKEYYIPNQRKVNKCLYTNSALYTPDVDFFLLRTPLPARTNIDIISCSPPNFQAAMKYYNIHSYFLEGRILSERLNFIKKICELNKIQILILGAWGCGSYHVDSYKLITFCLNIFNSSSTIESCIFAIPHFSTRNYMVMSRAIIRMNRSREK